LYETAKGFKNYGGRGISVCDQWADFKVFLLDMGKKPSPYHSIDRVDVNGNYNPENCRWATTKEQSRNKRSSRLVELNGSIRCAAEWSDETGIPAYVIRGRLDSGWTPEKAVSTHVKPRLAKVIIKGVPRSHLNENIVREIILSSGSQKSIGERFGIDPSTVSLIKSRKTWSHVSIDEVSAS